MIIFVKTATGRNYALEVGPSDSIASVKSKIAEREGIPASRQQIIFQSKPLPDETTIADAGIGTEATIHLILRDNGHGAGKEKSRAHSAGESLSSPAPRLAPPSGALTDLDDATKASLLASFARGTSTSNGVDIVFCFDTTGSMSSVIDLVRQKVSQTVARLLKDIPNLRIGIMNLGDYCDSRPLTTFDLSSDPKAICYFVNNQAATGGGDFPEAYELALREARTSVSWRDGSAKALVMIGDAVPHPPSYTTEKIDWKQELDLLANMDVKVYGVYCAGNPLAKAFYERLSERTGTVSISFRDFKLITDMFLAICYREASPQQLEKFKQEISDDGRLKSEAMSSIMNELSKPNPVKNAEPTEQRLEQKYPGLSACDWWTYRNAPPQYQRAFGRWMPASAAIGGWLSWLTFGYWH